MSLRRAASLSIVALISATWALAEMRGVRSPPSFTSDEVELIGRDQRLVDATRGCAWQLRQALDLQAAISHGSRLGVLLEPCQIRRASDEGALDILKILKEASEQGPNRSAPAAAAGSATKAGSPSFTSEEMALIFRNEKLSRSLHRCGWQVRQVLDSLLYGLHAGQQSPPCRAGELTRGKDEGALDILKILREASGESTAN
jgi:hypothetical protein